MQPLPAGSLSRPPRPLRLRRAYGIWFRASILYLNCIKETFSAAEMSLTKCFLFM